MQNARVLDESITCTFLKRVGKFKKNKFDLHYRQKFSDTKIPDKIFSDKIVSDVFQSFFGRFQRNFGRTQNSMYLVIFNALKRYLKVNSFKFV